MRPHLWQKQKRGQCQPFFETEYSLLFVRLRNITLFFTESGLARIPVSGGLYVSIRERHGSHAWQIAKLVVDSRVPSSIADIRSGTTALQTLILYGAEFRAWQTSFLSAIAAKAKMLTLPGGYTIYNPAWSDAEREKNADATISGFLINWAGITNPAKQ